jgi:hypothetical protein
MKGGIYRRGDERWNIQERRKCDSSWLWGAMQWHLRDILWCDVAVNRGDGRCTASELQGRRQRHKETLLTGRGRGRWEITWQFLLEAHTHFFLFCEASHFSPLCPTSWSQRQFCLPSSRFKRLQWILQNPRVVNWLFLSFPSYFLICLICFIIFLPSFYFIMQFSYKCFLFSSCFLLSLSSIFFLL